MNKSCSRETWGCKGFTQDPAAFCSERGNVLTKLVLARIAVHKQTSPVLVVTLLPALPGDAHQGFLNIFKSIFPQFVLILGSRRKDYLESWRVLIFRFWDIQSFPVLFSKEESQLRLHSPAWPWWMRTRPAVHCSVHAMDLKPKQQKRPWTFLPILFLPHSTAPASTPCFLPPSPALDFRVGF